jgi:hypothetical protein
MIDCLDKWKARQGIAWLHRPLIQYFPASLPYLQAGTKAKGSRLQPHSSPSGSGTVSGEQASSRQRYAHAHLHIVRFKEYKMAEQHRQALLQQLEEPGWEWVDRHNPAMKFPTDFGLLRLTGDSNRLKVQSKQSSRGGGSLIGGEG